MSIPKHLALIPVCALGWVGASLAEPSMECSVNNSSQVDIWTCLAEVEIAVEAARASALEYATAAAADLDQVTGRATSQSALGAAQASWSDYRNQHCEFVGSTFGGGSGTGIAIRSCRITMGRARTDNLLTFTQ